ncbi:MAG: Ldh family oxidoreductase [Chloroflexi bacterium]|nr:Ldh family oxidoreductase [Chloroflexota bacterium]
MLERFRVKEEEAVRVGEAGLRATVERIFEKMGVPAEDASLAADVLVVADLRGVDSHGVSNMLRSYVNSFNSGAYNPRPRIRIVRETPSTANIECDRGLGIIICPKAMRIAIQKAKDVGMGMVTMYNSRHAGMVSYHAMMALEHDMIGMAMTSTRPSVAPTFGREPRLGTNPIALAAPARSEPPFVFDAATSAVASNKFQLVRRLGALMEPGTMAAPDGTPIMEEAPAPERPTGLPLGSTRELGSHKGYGLGSVVDIMCAVLSGGGFGMLSGARGDYSHMVAAFRIDAFTDVDHFKDLMDQFLRTLKDTPPAAGQERVLYAGLPEHEVTLDRKARGIPLHPEVIQWFKDICGELDIPYTLARA